MKKNLKSRTIKIEQKIFLAFFYALLLSLVVDKIALLLLFCLLGLNNFILRVVNVANLVAKIFSISFLLLICRYNNHTNAIRHIGRIKKNLAYACSKFITGLRMM